MTAHEEQNQRVILFRLASRNGVAEDRSEVVEFPSATRGLAPQLIRHPPGGDLDQPSAWIVGKTFTRPLLRGGEQCFLDRVLGNSEVAEATDHRAENPRRQLPQQVFVGEPRCAARHTSTGGALMTSRTSIGM